MRIRSKCIFDKSCSRNLGAVINLAKKLEEGSDEEDALLIRQILDNLSEIIFSQLESIIR